MNKEKGLFQCYFFVLVFQEKKQSEIENHSNLEPLEFFLLESPIRFSSRNWDKTTLVFPENNQLDQYEW